MCDLYIKTLQGYRLWQIPGEEQQATSMDKAQVDNSSVLVASGGKQSHLRVQGQATITFEGRLGLRSREKQQVSRQHTNQKGAGRQRAVDGQGITGSA